MMFNKWQQNLNLKANVMSKKRIGTNLKGCITWTGTGVDTILIFQFSPGFGTEAPVPALPQYRFWYLDSGSCFSIPGVRYKVFRGFFAFVSLWYWIWFHFGSISAPNPVEPKTFVPEHKLTGT